MSAESIDFVPHSTTISDTCITTTVNDSNTRVPSFLVELAYLGPDRGYGLRTTRAIKRDEILFSETPIASFQLNRSLVPTCSNQECMRVIHDLSELIKRSHELYAQVMSQSGENGEAIELLGEPDMRKSKEALLQQILSELPKSSTLVPCRSIKSLPPSTVNKCTELFCCSDCEKTSWDTGHSILCINTHPELEAFWSHRNIARNPDAQVAVKIMARFIAAVQDLPIATLGLKESAGVIWKQMTTFHALPWSTVLASLAISAQTELPNEVVEAHLRHLNKTATASASSTISPPTLSASSAELLDSLNSTQATYRTALDQAFQLFASTIKQSKSPSKEFWLPYINIDEFDRLAGANRLNCSLTQTALPIPIIEEPPLAAPTPSELNLLTATEDTVPSATASSSSSSPSSPPFLVNSLIHLFSPMSLPLANIKALFPWHSKMNHSCAPNARVENMREDHDIKWTVKSMELVEELKQERKAQAESLKHGNKKKKQKNKLVQQQLKERIAKKEKEEIEFLEKIAHDLESPSNPPLDSSATSSATAPSMSPTLVASNSSATYPAESTCRIVIRAIRSIGAGEEICINYLPTQAQFRLRSARQDYLKKNYLFSCSCSRCTAPLVKNTPTTTTNV